MHEIYPEMSKIKSEFVNMPQGKISKLIEKKLKLLKTKYGFDAIPTAFF